MTSINPEWCQGVLVVLLFLWGNVMAKDKNKKVPENQESIRDEKGRFVPGVSGNLKGRPKKEFCITDRMREFLGQQNEEGQLRMDEFIRDTFEAAKGGDSVARKLIWNYIDGMPVQKVETGSSVLAELLEKWEEEGNKEE